VGGVTKRLHWIMEGWSAKDDGLEALNNGDTPILDYVIVERSLMLIQYIGIFLTNYPIDHIQTLVFAVHHYTAFMFHFAHNTFNIKISQKLSIATVLRLS
jgi:hypothetical protein